MTLPIRAGSEKSTVARRMRGERGSSMVTACVLLFTFTAGGIVWLARDVNRSISDRSAAQSVAFQAARAGAQQVDVGALRDANDARDIAEIDVAAARSEATRIATALAAAYDLRLTDAPESGRSIVTQVVGDRVTVAITIDATPNPITVQGSAQAQVGP